MNIEYIIIEKESTIMSFWKKNDDEKEHIERENKEKDEQIKDLQEQIENLIQDKQDLVEHNIQMDTYHTQDKMRIRDEYDTYIDESHNPIKRKNGDGEFDTKWLKDKK